MSFESVRYPNYYLRHYGHVIKLNADNGHHLYSEDASFILHQRANGFHRVESYNFRGYFMSQYGSGLKDQLLSDDAAAEFDFRFDGMLACILHLS